MAPSQLKLKNLEEAVAERRRQLSLGRKVVFTNGCFDLLHPGHTRYLQAARELGDYLVVAVNSDASVRAVKGAGRPIQDERVRAELLAALACVDAVLVFDEPDPFRVISALLPDVLVKGGDWAADRIIGADVVREAGGQVCRIPYIQGFSSSALIRRIRDLQSK